jgi:DNA polymerase III gamma/tau subunit
MTGSEEALRVIARKADGGMRDGLSILDQVLALSDGEVTSEAVRRVLGVVEEERYFQLFDLLASRDRSGLFTLIEDLLEQGYDLVEFYHGLMEGIRTLLRLCVGGGGADLPQERRGSWEEKAALFEAGELVRMLGMAAELETGGSLRRTSNPRVLLELLLLRFSYLDRTIDLRELFDAIGGDAPTGHLPTGAQPDKGRVGLDSGGGGAQGDLVTRVPAEPTSKTRAESASPRRSKKEGTLLAAFKETMGEEGESARITVNEARAGRLKDLIEKEPSLRPAVEELDLELLD